MVVLVLSVCALNEALVRACMNDALSLGSSLNTPPGTKVKLLGSVSVKNGFLLLDDSKMAVLGGEVEHMIEKWELQRVSKEDWVTVTVSLKLCA